MRRDMKRFRERGCPCGSGLVRSQFVFTALMFRGCPCGSGLVPESPL